MQHGFVFQISRALLIQNKRFYKLFTVQMFVHIKSFVHSLAISPFVAINFLYLLNYRSVCHFDD